MRKNIFDLSTKLNLIQLLSIEDSYFKSFDFQRKKKLSKEVIRINYGEYSPYDEFDISYRQSADEISLWYSQIPLESAIVVPESYILYSYFLDKGIEGLIVFDTSPQKLIVIKEGKLKSQFSKEHISAYAIRLLQKEFAIEHRHDFSDLEYQESIDIGIRNLSLTSLFDFLYLKLDKKSLFQSVIDYTAKPIAILVALLLVLEVINYFYIENSLKVLQAQYKNVKSQTEILRKRVNNIDSDMEQFEQLGSELKMNQKIIDSIESIAQIVFDENGTFQYIRVSEDSIEISLESNQTSSIFTKIINTKQFERLKIVNTQKMKFSDREKVMLRGSIR